MRGKVISSGTGHATGVDLQAELCRFQQELQLEFYRWLQRVELAPIRKQLATAARQAEKQPGHPVDLFISCHPLSLARLPWETWEIGAEFGSSQPIRIARTPIKIQAPAHSPSHKKRRRPRILVILGDERGLNFQKERAAIASLRKLADVVFMGWQPGKSIEQVKDDIQRALIHPQGWDVLFFAGHSNETSLTGGELGIAPKTSLQISEIKGQLAIAQQNGLQFALFNSCNGLNVAESLIDLGLSQVAIMREPIHNRVAEEFLVRFAKALAQHKDVHACLLEACQGLKAEKNLTYPAADLVPSLFRYPHTALFQIPPRGVGDRLRALKPTRYEAIALSTLLLMSLRLFVNQAEPGAVLRSPFPLQEWLLDQRLLVQAQYRQFTGRALATQPPPVALVQIDTESLNRAGIDDPNPIPHDYMNRVMARLADYNPPVVGLDYLLDREDPDQQALAQTLQQIQQQGIPLVFAKIPDHEGNWMTTPEAIAGPSSLHAFAIRSSGDNYHIPLQVPGWEEVTPLPFAYWLAWIQQHCALDRLNLCQKLASPAREQEVTNAVVQQMPRVERSPLTALGHGLGWQNWFHPITDFSMPPAAIYTRIPTWKLLEEPNAPELQHLSQQVVIVAAGAYTEAGTGTQWDAFPASSAMGYWYTEENPQGVYRLMTGGEHHAYLVHHALYNRWVMPVPNFWMVLGVALLGKLVAVWLSGRAPFSIAAQRQILAWMAGGSAIYILLSLELYLTPWAIALPIVLPLLTFWLCVSPVIFRKPL